MAKTHKRRHRYHQGGAFDPTQPQTRDEYEESIMFKHPTKKKKKCETFECQQQEAIAKLDLPEVDTSTFDNMDDNSPPPPPPPPPPSSTYNKDDDDDFWNDGTPMGGKGRRRRRQTGKRKQTKRSRKTHKRRK